MTENTSRTFQPKFDVKEAKEAYFLEGELPGIAQKDISIHFSDEQTLTVKGRAESSREEGPAPRSVQASEVTQDANTTAETKELTTTNQNKSVVQGGPQHTYWLSERSVGEFARSFSFPVRVDQERIKASLKNGILSITVPKLVETKKSKNIAIETEE